MRWVILALGLAACEKYVPVEIKVAIPEAPAECTVPIVKAKPLPKFSKVQPNGNPWTVTTVHAVWVRHEIEVQAATRENQANKAICNRYLERLRS